MAAHNSEGEPKTLLERLGEVFSSTPENRHGVMEMLREAEEKDIFDVEALNMMFGALQVSDLRVRDVLIPRPQLKCVGVDQPPEALLPMLIEAKHSRFPVIGDDEDDIRGVLHAKDLLPLAINGALDAFDIKDYMRAAAVVPESMRLNALLKEFRSSRQHMALVVDEYGHTSGAVTIEDVLEQIVGDIEDEHDVNEENFVNPLGDETFNIKAQMPLDDFNEYFGTVLEDDEVETIGGLVMRHLGHVPEQDEQVDMGPLQFTVLNAESRRIRLLRLELRAIKGPSD